MNLANIWRILGTLSIGAGVALARHQMLLGVIALVLGVGFFVLSRREQVRLEITRAQPSESDHDHAGTEM